MEISNLSFNGYYSKLKKLYKSGNLPSVKKGLYGEVLTKDNVSIEHLIPIHCGGKDIMSNTALATREANIDRSTNDIRLALTPEMAKAYLEQFKGVQAYKFKGNHYIDIVSRTLKSQGIDVGEV